MNRVRTMMILMSLFAVGTGWAQPRQRESPVISPSEAISIAQEQAGGRVISSELVRPPKGNPYYRVKILNDGKVQVIRVDASRR